MIGISLPSRRFSSSTSRTTLLRRITSRRQAACFSALVPRLSMAMRKSAWFSRSRCLSVARFGASRLSMRFFSAVLVTEISIVRSSRSSPLLHFFQQLDRALQHEVVGQQQVAEAGAGFLDPAGPRRFRRPGESIGISPICMRYMRIGSSMCDSGLPSSGKMLRAHRRARRRSLQRLVRDASSSSASGNRARRRSV